MDMNLQKYMALVKTVEYGSFTKAAEMLNYSQSGISRMINDLEKEWKVTLLERGRSGVRPTSDGMKILPYAENVCREYEKLQMQVEELNGLRSGLNPDREHFPVWPPSGCRTSSVSFRKTTRILIMNFFWEITARSRSGFSREGWTCGFLRLPVHAELETIFLEQDRLLVVLPEGHRLAGCDKFPCKRSR